ncbi:hypothetical protein [uncultured Roseobacter sp.]|uniref:hypothetical protein n=1 Tax=uncultured Roseobacter sp. TaxID=114847 RepID=UPI0026140A48|nr:hypothetical protein [uncultured Roseobacter sp.]
MDRLSIVLTFMVGAVITGAIVIPAFVMGYYSVWPVVIGAAASIVASWPISYVISRRIKRNDPSWDRTPSEKTLLPNPNAPEV